MIIAVSARGVPALEAKLEAHPYVALERFVRSAQNEIEFSQQGRRRVAASGKPSIGEYGLVELMDNNPLVCADAASCPGAAATLALIALGPLERAGVLAEPASAVFSFEVSGESDLPTTLHIAADPVDGGSALSMSLIASLTQPATLTEIVELYDECYARTFFVRRVPQLDPRETAGAPYAAYTVRFPLQDSPSTLQISVAADADGKCGAAQLVHLFNVMAGFEEDLGT
jgi:N-acetyl-gamma-glutamylphosphate reductase